MNIIANEDLQDLLAAATEVVDRFHSETGETISELFLLLQVVETVNNCVDDVKTIELAITPNGYELRYEGDVTEDAMHNHLAQALETIEEPLYEEVGPFDNTMSLPSSSRTAGF